MTGEPPERSPSSIRPRRDESEKRKKLLDRGPSTQSTRSGAGNAGWRDAANAADRFDRELADFYATAPSESEEERAAKILALEGSMSDDDGERMMAVVRRLRESWR